ncbi:DUF1890 domain-containing protein [Methanobrevibacter sp. TMH8]|uniref:DUF1890 domain-containing protein n=1 Tax=Methanobrevibacter sp. TMH8 TaxID=2848611 RepID=UPI001CCB546A|nr:DUF1890 domain-containing protein [Methanobrevibacter sp. TMH8]MBZ9570666.1 DUF1890 domain-containing protein [Methanobrevibacter sp. TMH8]
MKKALILLGCPESPSQTPIAIYAAQKLAKMDYEVTIASTPSAAKLLEVSDPDEYYVKNKMDIESCLDGLEQGQYDLLVGFVHKDAAASYFITFYHILQCEAIALVFEKDTKLIEEFENMVAENTDAKIVSVRAFHNPTPLRVKFDKVLKELQ